VRRMTWRCIHSMHGAGVLHSLEPRRRLFPLRLLSIALRIWQAQSSLPRRATSTTMALPERLRL
jgi:hypothetical protein